MEAMVLNAKPIENTFMFKTTQNTGQTPPPTLQNGPQHFTVKYETLLHLEGRLANQLFEDCKRGR